MILSTRIPITDASHCAPWAKPLPVLLLLTCLLSGCGSLTPGKTSESNLEKHIERQQEAYRLREQPEQKEQLSREEYERIGDGHLRKNDLNRAYFYYVKALSQEPENTILLHKQSSLLMKKKKFSEAEQVYRTLLSISSRDALAHEGLGRTLIGQNRIGEAEKAFLAALALNNDLWQSHHFLGLAYSSQEKYDKAVVEFKQALKLKPQDRPVLNNLAVTYCLQGRYEEAEPILRTLADSSNNKKIFNNLAVVYVHLERYAEALSAFKKGAASEAAAYYNMGVEYMSHEMFPEAIGSFEQAIALHPRYYPAAVSNMERAKKAMQ
jgi:Flp pilus assembly protein TadD